MSTIPARVLNDVRNDLRDYRHVFNMSAGGAVPNFYELLRVAAECVDRSCQRHALAPRALCAIVKADGLTPLPTEVYRAANCLALVLIDTLEGLR